MVESRRGRTAIKNSTLRSLSSLSRGDWRCVLHSQRARYTTRSPVPKGRFNGRPNKSQKEHYVCLSGSRQWCYNCRFCVHFPVLTPTHKHGPFSVAHSSTAHINKTGSRRVCFKCRKGARFTVLTPTHKHGSLCDTHSLRAPVNKHKMRSVCREPINKHKLCYVCEERARPHDRLLANTVCYVLHTVTRARTPFSL